MIDLKRYSAFSGKILFLMSELSGGGFFKLFLIVLVQLNKALGFPVLWLLKRVRLLFVGA
ncbi:hypothetical protein [Microbulbifer sp. PSTR4-B]|uniref:hypothetical protein n=1 Tax=Microbulbifer sp. PSTR4-B TaxID=3243396 RepID=UPI004039EDD5